MRKEMPLVSFSVESDTQKHGKDCEETHTFFVIFLLIRAAARPFSDSVAVWSLLLSEKCLNCPDHQKILLK